MFLYLTQGRRGLTAAVGATSPGPWSSSPGRIGVPGGQLPRGDLLLVPYARPRHPGPPLPLGASDGGGDFPEVRARGRVHGALLTASDLKRLGNLRRNLENTVLSLSLTPSGTSHMTLLVSPPLLWASVSPSAKRGSRPRGSPTSLPRSLPCACFPLVVTRSPAFVYPSTQ